MALIALAVIIGIPIIEIYVFAAVGGEIGPLATVAATVATAAAGIVLFRSQGRGIADRAREAMDRGEMPLAEVMDGLGLALAGLMLLIPGFVTDAIGFLLFVPPLRLLVVAGLVRNLMRSSHATVIIRGRDGSGGGRPGPGSGPVIDGDYEDVTRNGGGAGEPGDSGSGDRRIDPPKDDRR